MLAKGGPEDRREHDAPGDFTGNAAGVGGTFRRPHQFAHMAPRQGTGDQDAVAGAQSRRADRPVGVAARFDQGARDVEPVSLADGVQATVDWFRTLPEYQG